MRHACRHNSVLFYCNIQWGRWYTYSRMYSYQSLIATPDCRKTKHVCYVNLLEKYHEHDPRFVTCITTEPASVLHETVPDESTTDSMMDDTLSSLSPEEQAELKDLLAELCGRIFWHPGEKPTSGHTISSQFLAHSQFVVCHIICTLRSMRSWEKNWIIFFGTWAFPIVLVKKFDSTIWLCTDFRKINAITVPDPFLIPRVEDLLDPVGRSKYLTNLDTTCGYWQVPPDEESAPMSAFVMPYGHCQWCYMPFGLGNAPATISRLVLKLLQGIEEFSVAYLDDILGFSDMW